MWNLVSKGSCDTCYRRDVNICYSCVSQNSFLLECVIWIDLLENINISISIYMLQHSNFKWSFNLVQTYYGGGTFITQQEYPLANLLFFFELCLELNWKLYIR